MHSASNKSAGGNIICNCRRCCCTTLRYRNANPALTPVASYECWVDLEKCIACESCVGRCPTGSIVVDEVAVINARTCLGCGLCATECPVEAMAMCAERTPRRRSRGRASNTKPR